MKKRLDILDLLFLNYLVGSVITELWKLLEFLIHGEIRKNIVDTLWLLGLILIMDLIVTDIDLRFEYKNLKIVFWNSTMKSKLAFSKEERGIQVLKSGIEWRKNEKNT